MNRHFAPGGEFSLIETLFAEDHFSRTGEGIGDDGYLLKTAGGETWAVSCDTSFEGIHYRLDWTTPAEALAKAVLSNLSDINAMGGRATHAFLTLGALKSWDRAMLRSMGASLRSLEERHGFRVVGGDTVRKEKESSFGVTVMGPVTGKPLLRSAARPGHRLFISGRLGASASGLDLLRRGIRPGADARFDRLIAAHALPTPPLDLGPALAALEGPVAAIDVSDGLSSELSHLSVQSGCRPVIEWGKLAYDPDLASAWSGEGSGSWRDWVLHGGEEYQLLFAADPSATELRVLSALAPIVEIGRVAEGAGVGMIGEDGVERELESKGFSH